MPMYKTIRPYLFKFDPENMHTVAEKLLMLAQAMPLVLENMVNRFCFFDERLRQNILGLNFYNPTGLAAGFDKNATMIKGLSSLGFGFIEIGTITPKPQDGNPKPRIFRFVEENSIQNAMGFNNDGAKVISRRFARIYPFILPLGVNIGKNKITEQEKVLFDYKKLVSSFRGLGDYFTINLSSPNTPNLRDLQNEEFVKVLMQELRKQTDKPIFLKISPDMSIDYMLDVCECAINNGANGIIATNTTIDYSLLKNAKDFGGISGEALKKKSREIFQILSENLFGKTILISVGGINDGDEAYERIKLGASLVQVYSGMIFEGPSIIKDINQIILNRLEEDGFKSISEAIGKGLR
ncbi:quinone-dependent dihydroorotate dehydrogenase [Helicobacter sp. MIT 14-3879]|uniref:quinone-dependent dihydroorotate dehydrogenase n=1 Tax=Helicobacter sp. MIT 14-3879 TaxID=2040649 RepID=UPI000E1EE477|nr:quinone-dependent dihydroorotate dehydrogenase [Helicobacter sp. MIT 14-3879]RDU65062.1 dihydroorotate dehydrogenase (quinone) [Helicobacter sp. MIT 14-3879]